MRYNGYLRSQRIKCPFSDISSAYSNFTFGRFIIPGSTVVTQLKKDETSARGYVLYDTKTKSNEFVEIPCRKFFYEDLSFNNASIAEVKNAVGQKIGELKRQDSSAVIRIKISGTVKEGLMPADLTFASLENVYVDNDLDAGNLKGRLQKIKNAREQKLSVRELAIKELEDRIKDRIKRFSVRELFEKLAIGTDEAMEYVKNTKDGETTHL